MEQPQLAVKCLKYMLLAKMMTDSPSVGVPSSSCCGSVLTQFFVQDVYAIINGKSGVKYAGPQVGMASCTQAVDGADGVCVGGRLRPCGQSPMHTSSDQFRNLKKC